MGLDANALLHGPLFSRATPLDRNNAASRISAYVYGNVLVLAVLIPIVPGPNYVGIAIVLGTALSTFVAHAFAESVGHSVRERSRLTTAERRAEVRDSVPILTSRSSRASSSRSGGSAGSSRVPLSCLRNSRCLCGSAASRS